MRKFIFILFISISVFTSVAQESIGNDSLVMNYASPSEYVIGGIIITGADHMDKNIIIALTGIAVGDKIQVPGEKIATAIENLWKQGLFEDVKITATKVIGKNIFFEIILAEKPRLSKFSFKGVKKGDADDLREKIQLLRGKPVTDYLLASTKTKVKEHFVHDGYMNTKVSIREQKDSSSTNTVTLFITVDKGKKVRVNQITFHGNNSLPEKKLKRALKETKEKKWWNIFNSGKYLEENLIADEPKAMQKYLLRGYRDAHIVKDTVYKISENRVNIDITIDEGKKYYFRNITWVGNGKYTSKELNSILGIQKGDVFDQSVLDTKLNLNPNGIDVSSLYMDDGYLFFQITPVEVLVENDSIDLEIRIYEGKQAIINKVTVTGNSKTNDHVIMREIRTKPGQLFRRSDIIRSQRELAQLGYFDAEKLNVNPVPNPANGTVDIEYIVQEKPSDQLELSGGWGGGRVIGTLGVSFNNFSARNVSKKNAWRPLPSGDGQRLSIRAQSTGPAYWSTNLSFTEPWLGGKKPNSLSVSGYQTVQTSRYLGDGGERLAKSNRSFLAISGLSMGLGKRLKKPDDYFTLYQELSYQYYVANKMGGSFILSDGFSNNISYKISLSRNSIDKPIFETRGSQISITGQFTPPYSLFNNKDYSHLTLQERYKFIEYQKYKFTAAWFTPLTNKKAAEGKEARNLILYTKAGYGFVGLYNQAVGRSPFELFSLGGSGLTGYTLFGKEIIGLRGYEDGSLSPSVGSPIVSKYTAELRYPISLNPQATVFVLGFAEAGNSWVNMKNFNPFELKRSAGIGVRIFLPMFGLLGFDYGWGFDTVSGMPSTGRNPYTGKAQGQFHFTIGAALGEL